MLASHGLGRCPSASTTGSPSLASAASPEIQRRQIEPAERLHQAEAGLLVIGERMGGNDAPVVARQPDLLGFGDQIADGQHQPVLADDHAAALPLGAQRRRREGVLGNRGMNLHDGLEGMIEFQASLL